MRLLIRDDDTCAFTGPEEISSCYERYWDRLPISLAITPFRIPGENTGVPDALYGSQQPLALEENGELVDFLREQVARGRVHIALHGFHHNRVDGLPEYVRAPDLHRKTREGKRYLEQLLGCQINTFVPPNNGIGAEGLRAIAESGLNLVNVPSLLSGSMRRRPWRNLIKFCRVQYYHRVKGMRYPYLLHFDDHSELAYHSITPSQTGGTITEAFRRCAAAGGIFVLATHYHAFEKRLRSGETVGDVVDCLASEALSQNDIQGVGCSDVWRSYR